jgi:hypothetical protein
VHGRLDGSEGIAFIKEDARAKGGTLGNKPVFYAFDDIGIDIDLKAPWDDVEL